jgi:hypothetical protein
MKSPETLFPQNQALLLFFLWKGARRWPDACPPEATRPSPNAILTKAALRAADRLDLSAIRRIVIGVSEATVSRMKKGEFVLERGSKPFELALLFVRLFRSLDAIVGGDEGGCTRLAQVSQWARSTAVPSRRSAR